MLRAGHARGRSITLAKKRADLGKIKSMSEFVSFQKNPSRPSVSGARGGSLASKLLGAGVGDAGRES